ncbi:MAG: MFS transporter [Chloroflexota bacterium]
MNQQLLTERWRQIRDFRVPKELHTFTTILLGQLLSQTASGAMVFALMIWVFQQDNSFTDFSLILLAAMIPTLIVSPVAGVLVDRWPRRWVIIGADTGAILISATVGYLAWTDQLLIWHLYVAAALAAIFDSFQETGFAASIALLVPKRHLMRVNGMSETAEAISEMLAPLLAGFLLVSIGLVGIIIIDIVTFFIAISIMLYVKFPELPRWSRNESSTSDLAGDTADSPTIVGKDGTDVLVTQAPLAVETEEDEEEDLPIWDSLKEAYRYLVERPGLMIIVYFFMVNAFVLGLVGTLTTPYALTFMSPDVLGFVATVSGSGLLFGGLIVSIRGDKDGYVRSIIMGMIALGFGIALLGIWPSVTLYTIAMFVMALSAPFVNSAIQAVFQSKVATDMQGRVFAMVGTMVGSVNPIALLLGGIIADQLFEPLLVEGGLLANSVGLLIGTGPGRGVGLMCILIGLVSILFTLFFARSPRLLNVETELPDAVADGETDETGKMDEESGFLSLNDATQAA